jgi:prepilin-type N-terminal cleavage/methylation domain-containing protein
MKIFPSRRRAFTLVEIMVSSGVLAIIMAVLMRGFIQGLNIYYYETGKILVNKDIRKFTSEMTEYATYANYFKVFPAYNNLSRSVDTLVNPSDPDQGYSTAITDTSVNDGLSGDCLVLVYKDSADDRKISRLIGYFRAPDSTGTGPVRRFDLLITPSSSLPLWQLIPEISDPAVYPQVIELSRGLANGKLFYNFYDKAIIVKGEIIHRGGMTNSRNATATNTYNFTVSPRG